MTTPARNAQTAALEALIEAHAIELKLPTVRRRFKPLAAEALREQQTPVAYLAALLEAEMAERAERREKRRLIDARFPQIKRLEDFRFADNPKVPQATIAALAEGSWIDDRESVIFIGDSGTGKTMLATALAVCACHQGRRVRFTTLAALANELQEAQGNRELERVIDVGRVAARRIGSAFLDQDRLDVALVKRPARRRVTTATRGERTEGTEGKDGRGGVGSHQIHGSHSTPILVEKMTSETAKSRPSFRGSVRLGSRGAVNGMSGKMPYGAPWRAR